MNELELTAEGEFVVRESKITNFIFGGAMLAVFFVSLFFGDYGWGNYLMGACIFLIPGAIAIAKGRRNTTIIRINKTGVYYAGRLVTDWNRFYDAVVRDKMQAGSYNDNFVLDLRYYAFDYSLLCTESIPLTNTQDKGEEEIIEAISFYKNLSKELAPSQAEGSLSNNGW
ncbi:hypothetical protein [Flavisolibacter tropicus]|uniref:Uncharacterized protein n=1 Tax=Flavisolibacter tropicus TaxID=1492898 RepID=A0A172TXX4_9BACT|nr:hypothetical protein [Flavisolibacter tropicus]ANE51935.1 hypothetical protein SY85_16990 [Flavisolibacter tropicus]